MLPSQRTSPRPPHPLDDPHFLIPVQTWVLQVPNVLQEALPEPAPRRQPRLRVLPERRHGEQQQTRGKMRNRALSAGFAMLVPVRMRLRYEEALDAPHGEPSSGAPPCAAQVPISRRASEEPTQISTCYVDEGTGWRNADKGKCKFLGL